LNAALIVQSALSRHESRGLHFSKDYPEPLANPKPTILSPNSNQSPFCKA
jgi:L-aspartate oxidase